MKIIITLLILFILTNLVLGQQFKLTDEQGSFFSLDHFTNELYFAREPSIGIVKKINLTTKVVSEANFPSLPVFMHNSHKAVYKKITDSSNIYYLYDYVTDSTKQILENHFDNQLLKANSFWPWYSISPDDTKLLNFSAFIIEDSSWIYLSDNVAIPTSYIKQEWSSDTSFIFFSLNNALAEYNFTTGKVDTLVTKNERILNFAYNIKYDLLAYSIGEEWNENKIFIYDKYTKTDELVFDPSDSLLNYYCRGGWSEFNDLAWSPDLNYLVFLGYNYINPGTGIHIYDVLSKKNIYVTDCDHVGLKKNVIWTSNDIIIYAYGNNVDQVYGFNLSSILTSVSLSSSKKFTLSLSNYPNPFNPSTRIRYQVPNYIGSETIQPVQLIIYDMLGRKIRTLVNEKQKAGIYEITWNGKNSNYQKISSGIYLARLVVNNKGNINHKSIKLLLLK